ncbi:MAG: hypothetical protein VR73_04015 [Gammaproteobacteria bacterium BRH_c0]|nr:MAG: hypothetical protein VR73_04015 [Gammaproteobacteria bacterium BRH_c0]
MKIYAPGLTLLFLLPPALWAEEPQPLPEPAPQDNVWLDSSHEYVVGKADNIAVWMDNFFGVNRVDEEAPYSTLRLRVEQEWDEMEGWETGLKLRGKVHLPKLNKRLSLLFADDDEKTGQDDLLLERQNSPDDVALQYTAREKKHYRVDFKVGLRSSLHPKTSARYRYEHPLSDSIIGRFSQEALYRTDDGFGSRTRLEFDKILDENKVLQWYNRVEWEEEESGVSMNTGLAFNRRLGEHRALGYFIAISGKTDPEAFSTAYGFGMRYRQNIYKEWLFAEVQPNYFWRRAEFEDSREGAAAILFRLEAVFTRDWD